MTLSEWARAVDARIVAEEPSLEYAFEGKLPPATGLPFAEAVQERPRWSSHGRFVSASLTEGDVRVVFVPPIEPLVLETVQERSARKDREARYEHRFRCTDVDVGRAVQLIAAYLRFAPERRPKWPGWPTSRGRRS